MDPDQLRNAINDICSSIDLQSDDATELLLMIGAHESGLGKYLKQIKGPACGWLQMEKNTYDDIWANYIRYHAPLKRSIYKSMSWFVMMNNLAAQEMAVSLRLATIMGRVHLLRKEDRLPYKRDTAGMSKYAKTYWNTPKGKATPDDYLKAYQRLVVGQK